MTKEKWQQEKENETTRLTTNQFNSWETYFWIVKEIACKPELYIGKSEVKFLKQVNIDGYSNWNDSKKLDSVWPRLQEFAPPVISIVCMDAMVFQLSRELEAEFFDL